MHLWKSLAATFAVWFALLAVTVARASETAHDREPPNVLWIYVDDMSDWLGCYGDPTVPTPHIDRLAAGGVRFENAFCPSPVCSTTRSAIITGTMQTTHGLHHHRTRIKKSLPRGVTTVPELFRAAGYMTFNEAKDDFNFVRDRAAMYSPEFKRPGIKSHLADGDLTWLKQLQGQRFFGQIQLRGGKLGGETGSKFPAESRVDPADVTVPRQYPDVPEFRNAIARHYEQIAQTDEQVGAIVAALKKYELWDNTAVFFFTDHGCPLPRAKQFLYDEGVKVPLIVHWPLGASRIGDPASVRKDLVSGIDIAATSLALAGVEVPEFMEARDLFGADYEPRTHVISARDRCGIAVDRIRTVRTANYRYIRNYKPDRQLFQPQYRDNYATFKTLQQLLAEKKLSPLQASYFHDKRPVEELYDLTRDPHEAVNLASDPKHAVALEQHRRLLKNWTETTGDQGHRAESKESLLLVYKQHGEKCVAPEFDFARQREQ